MYVRYTVQDKYSICKSGWETNLRHFDIRAYHNHWVVSCYIHRFHACLWKEREIEWE
jgi:hypothetical protein